MPEMRVKILRDVAKNPNIIQITNEGRTLTVNYDGDNMTFIGDRSLMPSVPEVLQMAFPYELEGQIRSTYYDRTIETKMYSYYAPHAAALAPITIADMTYTVPSSKKAFVESIFLQLFRTVAATTEKGAYIEVQVNPTGTAMGAHELMKLYFFDNNVGAHESEQLSSPLLLQTGDTLTFLHADTSIGGTLWHFIGVKISEFDI